MKSNVVLLLAGLLLISAVSASADVQVQRVSSENPVMEVARSTFYGGLAGLVLGTSIALVSGGGGGGEIIKWGYAGGTFIGFAYGLHYVASRPRPTALIEVDRGTPHLAIPTVSVAPEQGPRITLLAARF